MTTVTEEDISKSLDLGNVPPIELVIRTKGDQAQRTSGFMSRWIGYAELYFTAKKCPEFDKWQIYAIMENNYFTSLLFV